MSGAPVRGTAAPQAWVRGMFGRVAGRYDFLNHLLSLNIDRYWRARTVGRVSAVLRRPDARIVDLCCGTGDLAIALEKEAGRPVIASDFCAPMLAEARRKLDRRGLRSGLVEADALRLPFPDGSLDLVTIAFGFRNLVDYPAGLAEMHRVLKPGGVLAILEFSKPPGRLFGALYNGYSRWILPTIGGLVSGSREAYAYLPASVRRFPGPEELAAAMRQAGFLEASFTRMTGGIVALHVGSRGPVLKS